MIEIGLAQQIERCISIARSFDLAHRHQGRLVNIRTILSTGDNRLLLSASEYPQHEVRCAIVVQQQYRLSGEVKYQRRTPACMHLAEVKGSTKYDLQNAAPATRTSTRRKALVSNLEARTEMIRLPFLN